MENKEYRILEENFFEVIIVGGGPCSLAVASRLCERCPGSIYTEDEHQRFHWLKKRGNKVNLINRNVSSHTKFKKLPKDKCYNQQNILPEDIKVIDSISDNFMGQWNNQFDSCQIPFLRSPMFFHPDPVNIDGMYNYAYLNKRDNPKDLFEIKNVIGKEYSKHQHKKLSKKKYSKVPVPNDITHNKSGIIDVNMRDWRDYYRPSTGLFKDFCLDIIERYKLHDIVVKDTVTCIVYTDIIIEETGNFEKGFIITTSRGKVYGCKYCVVASGHKGKINYQEEDLSRSCHTTHIFERKVEFPDKNLIMKAKRGGGSVVVVGGGLTSAQIASVLANKGVKNIYLLFRGRIKVKHFDFHLDWVTKYKNVKKSAFYIRDTDEERIQMINEAREGGSVNPEYYRLINKLAKLGKLKILQHTTIKEKSWNGSSWEVKLQENIDNEITLSNVDYIYYATGITQDLENITFMQHIIKNHPIPIVQGYPCLTDDLQWNKEIPLFMIGKNAALKMGPSSANLDGARLGAERIGWYIQELRSKHNAKQMTSFDNVCDQNCECTTSSSDDLDEKLDEEYDSDSSDQENTDSTFETRLKLASGQLNWYSLLENS